MRLVMGSVDNVAHTQSDQYMIEFRVIDLSTETIDPKPKIVSASTPERAAELALGLSLVRSGAKQHLRARVYSQHPGQPVNMVRLYTRVVERQIGENGDA